MLPTRRQTLSFARTGTRIILIRAAFPNWRGSVRERSLLCRRVRWLAYFHGGFHGPRSFPSAVGKSSNWGRSNSRRSLRVTRSRWRAGRFPTHLESCSILGACAYFIRATRSITLESTAGHHPEHDQLRLLLQAERIHHDLARLLLSIASHANRYVATVPGHKRDASSVRTVHSLRSSDSLRAQTECDNHSGWYKFVKRGGNVDCEWRCWSDHSNDYHRRAKGSYGCLAALGHESRAGDRIRTGDVQLGKLAFYH
jgi:hypothetical protein